MEIDTPEWDAFVIRAKAQNEIVKKHNRKVREEMERTRQQNRFYGYTPGMSKPSPVGAGFADFNYGKGSGPKWSPTSSRGR